jgi:hypothetical protein
VKDLLNFGSVQLTFCNRHRQVKRFIIGQLKAVAIDPKENHRGEQCKSLIAIDQRVIACKGVHQSAGLSGACGINLFPEKT